MDFDVLSDDESQKALGLAVLFDILMFVMMTSVSTWDDMSWVMKGLILVLGLPVYYVVAKIMIDR